MSLNARYVHTNLIAKDWRALCKFYRDVFGCLPIPPLRNVHGDVAEQGTGIPNAAFEGMHLKLPGYGNKGPTLEIFQYRDMPIKPELAANRPGFGHIAFEVSNLDKARDSVIASGGKAVGEKVTLTLDNRQSVTFIYLSDPEGNIIEVQSWS